MLLIERPQVPMSPVSLGSLERGVLVFSCSTRHVRDCFGMSWEEQHSFGQHVDCLR